jgi:hypothetical protein
MRNKLSLLFIALTALGITLLIAQPGLARPLFSSPIPPPSGSEAIWCANITAVFNPGPGAREMSFVATLTNTTYVTTPTTYPLNIPPDRVQVGIWQEQRRRQTDTGFRFPVPATTYGASSAVTGTFPAPATGSPVRYYLRLWDNVDGAWGREVCEPPPEVINPPAQQPPPPTPTLPISGTWQTTYDPITFQWIPPTLAAGVPPVLDYELAIIWGDGATQSVTTTLTQTTVMLPAALDQPVSWQVRARNSAGYGRWSEPAWAYGIDTASPALTPISEVSGVISGTWQNVTNTPVFTWAGSDPAWGSGLGYLMDWTTTLPCIPSTFTSATTYAPSASGINYLCVQARDGAGNRSQVETFEFRYDPPGVSLDLTPALAAVYPGQQLAATVTVTNVSLAGDVFTMTSDSGTWTLSGLPASLNMTGGEGQSRMLTLTVPADAVDGDVHVVPISATGQTGVYAMQSMTATVSRPDALVVRGANNLSGRPGETLTYTLSLTNGAVTEMIFDLAAISGWPVTLPASLTVAALDSVDFAVAMPVPAAAIHGAANLATITATNHDYPAITLTATITGTANRLADSLAVTPASQTVLPSQAVVYTLTISNGSGVVDTFDLQTISAWPVSLPGSLTVGGGGSVTVPLTILVPGGVVSGTVHAATITAVSRANGAVQLSQVITSVVSQIDRLKTTLLPPARVLNVPAGQSITTSATIWYENNSNYPDELFVTYTLPSGWTGEVSAPLNFSLDPLASRLGALALTIPDTVSSGAYRVPMTITGKHQQETVWFDTVIVRQASGSSSYLPVIFKGQTSLLPDLTGSFTFVSGAPVVTVENIGQVAAGDFWVDFYIDPASPPTGPNQPWDYLCSVPPEQCQGLAWYVSAPIPPGGRVTLTPTEGYPPNSRWSGGLSGTHSVYLFVDSWNPTVATGAVVERNEGNNRSGQVVNLNGTLDAQQAEPFEPVAGRVRRAEKRQ